MDFIRSQQNTPYLSCEFDFKILISGPLGYRVFLETGPRAFREFTNPQRKPQCLRTKDLMNRTIVVHCVIILDTFLCRLQNALALQARASFCSV